LQGAYAHCQGSPVAHVSGRAFLLSKAPLQALDRMGVKFGIYILIRTLARWTLKKLNIFNTPTPILTYGLYKLKRIILMGKAYGKNEKIAATLEALVKSIDEVAVYAGEDGNNALVASTSTLAIATGGIIDEIPDNELPSQARDELKEKLEEIRNTLYPDQELPEGGGGTADNALPGEQPEAGNELPDAPEKPDQELPPTAAPKS